MTLTYGFYNSVAGDRVYNAIQMSSIFDGMINDGVYATIGDKLMVSDSTGMNVLVGTGRAWFNHTWSYNDAAITITVPTADPLLPRIDVIYLEVNENTGVRANKVDILTGTPASTPVAPALTNTSVIHQYALAHIYVGAGVTVINPGDITNKVGTVDTPFVYAIVDTADELQAQIDAIETLLAGHDHVAGNGGLITGDAIAGGTIESGNIGTGAVTTVKIGDYEVNTQNIALVAVTNDRLANNAVTEGKIAANAVTPAKIPDRTRVFLVPAIPLDAGMTLELYGVVLADGVTDRAVGWFRVPNDFVSGMVVKTLIYCGASGFIYSTNTVYYGAVGQAYNAHSNVFGPGAISITASVQNEIQSLDMTNAAIGDYVRILYVRDAANSQDTLNQQAFIMGWLVSYTADS